MLQRTIIGDFARCIIRATTAGSQAAFHLFSLSLRAQASSANSIQPFMIFFKVVFAHGIAIGIAVSVTLPLHIIFIKYILKQI